MKLSILALGALATTASAGWIIPEVREGHPAPPHSSHPPSNAQHGHHDKPSPAYMAAHAAQSSLTHSRPCHSHPHPGKTSLGGALTSLRSWLANHNIMNYHPASFLRSPPAFPPPPDRNLPEWVLAQSKDITAQVDWYDAVFTDDDPSRPLPPAEMREKIVRLIQGAQGDYLPTLVSGQVRVVRYGQGVVGTRVYYPGHGRLEGGGNGWVVVGGEDDEGVRRKIDEAIQRAANEAKGLRPSFVSVQMAEKLHAEGPNGNRWVPVYGARPAFAGHGDERPGGGLHGKGGWHHRRPETFSGRLQKAMKNLRPSESLAMAFVLGAGLGSILHMFFMLTLLLTRRIRCGRLSKEERKARRAERRARRRAGGVRLEGEDVICVLRAPEPAAEGAGVVGQGEGLVEEGLPGYEEDAALAAKLAREKA